MDGGRTPVAAVAPGSWGAFAIRRILFFTHSSYLDDSNGAAVASRALMELLGRSGFAVEVLSGAMVESDREVDLVEWLVRRRVRFEPSLEGHGVDAQGRRVEVPPNYRARHRGVPVTLHRGPTTRIHAPDEREAAEFHRLFDLMLQRFAPDVLVGYGGDPLANAMRSQARARGIAVVFPLHNFAYDDPRPFEDVDEVIVPSRFAAEHYRLALGLRCEAIPNPIDVGRVRVESRNPHFLTFVNPSYEKGVYAFARIAEELGRRRPDIPLLVVEGRGTERTLADCGLDLTALGNVHLMDHTHDPRRFWGVTKVCLMPSLWRETQGLVAVEAMLNGIPVVASDRGALPETLGGSGAALPLPDWLTPASRTPPTAEEVGPWVEAVIRLWDDPAHLAEQSRRSVEAARRLMPEAVGPRLVELFAGVRPGRGVLLGAKG